MQNNWNYCFFRSKDLKAFISVGGVPSVLKRKEAQLIYNVTVSDLSHKEILQEEFTHLDDAMKYIEKQYGHWDFENPLLEKKGSGCSSCSAH